jgi:tetratricopeptide (TPR) repeat protein
MQYAFGAIIVLAVAGIAFIVLRRLPEYGGDADQGANVPMGVSPRLALFAGLDSVSRAMRTVKMPSLAVFRPSLPEREEHKSVSAMKHVSLGAIRSDERGEDFWIGLIESDPNNPYLYKKLGEFYIGQGKRQFARETFQYALKLSPDDESIKERLKEV